ncbi:hypothetical protein BDV93DRAFT_608285 [Ceratobasidium sp. AG-I]|nr:hypothetical protein BDV93DRAFT_608285 [Ceratobasidium sp. AG-I]
MFKSRPSGGMLGSVGAKIAHTSTIPGLGNSELRTLQELITAEKGVLLSVQRLAGDVGRSAEMLKNWGMGEGDDLGDVLGHSTNLLAHFSAALTQFSTYEERIRTQLKSVRSREEGLDEMRRRKRSVDSKAEAADKKLAKMGSEHKGRMGQVELLNELKQEGRQLEIDILKEEAAIGDYKRRTTREFMGLKFSGMSELAEKITIIGDLGKLMIEEISLQTTQPGHPRAPYTGREKTSELSSEATRCISEVRLTLPDIPGATSAPAATSNYDPYNTGYDVGAAVERGDGYAQDTYGSTAPGGAPYSEFGETPRNEGGAFSAGSLRIGDDGARIGNTGSQFATFPSSGRGLGDGLPALGTPSHNQEPTFSSSIADALAHDPNFNGPEQTPPSPPPHQPSVPQGTFAPPAGPPPGMQSHASESYFQRALPDHPPPEQSSPFPQPPAMANSSPWASVPSSPNKGRPLPIVNAQPPQLEQIAGTELAYAREEPSSPSRRPYRRQNSGEFNYPYSDNAFFVRNHAASSRPLRDPSPNPASDPDHEQREITSAAAREVTREMDTLAMAPYATSPPRPTPAQAVSNQGSIYGTPTEYPNPLSTPLPRPPMAPSSPAPSLPPLAAVPPISAPDGLASPTGRTIPASAFRRTASRSDTLDIGGLGASVSPLSVRKKAPGEDLSRGPSPAPISPGAPPMYTSIDDQTMDSTRRERSMSPGAYGDGKNRSDLT